MNNYFTLRVDSWMRKIKEERGISVERKRGMLDTVRLMQEVARSHGDVRCLHGEDEYFSRVIRSLADAIGECLAEESEQKDSRSTKKRILDLSTL